MNEELKAINAKLELQNLLLKAQETLESNFLGGEDARNVQALIASLNQYLEGSQVDVPLSGNEPHIKLALSRIPDESDEFDKFKEKVMRYRKADKEAA